MVAEAFKKGIINKENAGELRKHFKQISSLNSYWADTVRILNLNLLLLTTNETIIHAAQPERVAAGLLTNDSMIVACMRDIGIRALATNDRDFDRAIGITVYKPEDIP
ncbi:MAG: type II toxin-antitoxin system VapC family toxin [Blastocatellia bacterium]|nr:type II toxin-antitoxin system VapC family toxin [Blastocatellia bacterium]